MRAMWAGLVAIVLCAGGCSVSDTVSASVPGSDPQPQTTAVSRPTSTESTSASRPLPRGYILNTPPGCATCSDLVEALEPLGVVLPITVSEEGTRVSARLFDDAGVLAAEWLGDEPTVPPGERAVGANAPAMIEAACDAFPDLCVRVDSQVSEVVWGDWDRRYSWGGIEPAPLGLLEVRESNLSINGRRADEAVVSGILIDFGWYSPTPIPGPCFGFNEDGTPGEEVECEQPDPHLWATLYFGEIDGEPLLARFRIDDGPLGYVFDGVIPDGGTEDDIYVTVWTPSPFADPPSFDITGAWYTSRLRSFFLGRLVVGRQYVFTVVQARDVPLVCGEAEASCPEGFGSEPFYLDNLAITELLTSGSRPDETSVLWPVDYESIAETRILGMPAEVETRLATGLLTGHARVWWMP